MINESWQYFHSLAIINADVYNSIQFIRKTTWKQATNVYQQALDYLYSFIDYSLTKKIRYSPEKFDLSRMEKLLERIGNPHQKYPVVHVAGTRGKGSTSAMIVSILTGSGI